MISEIGEFHAAIVAQLAPDPQTHSELLEPVAKTETDNATETESMVRDALEAPVVQSIMEDFFGSAETIQILFKERAPILSAAATAIRKDRAAFSTLVKEEGRIAKASNTLVTDKNAERATQDAELLATLQATARRKGPIADALATAAKQLHEGQAAKTVIGNFLDVLRSGNKETGESGRGTGGTGRKDEVVKEEAKHEPASDAQYIQAGQESRIAYAAGTLGQIDLLKLTKPLAAWRFMSATEKALDNYRRHAMDA